MRYIFPPRPKSRIKPSQLDAEEKKGCWLWQPKYDGDRCVTAIEAGEVHLGNRHNKWHSARKFPDVRREVLGLKLPKDGTHYLDGEMIKDDGRDILVLFDVLQITNYLIGVPQMERLEMLSDVCGETLPMRGGMALQVSDHIYLAPHGFDGFAERYASFIENPLIEGLLLRLKDSTLDNWGPVEYEVDWQLRCRRNHKNYRF